MCAPSFFQLIFRNQLKNSLAKNVQMKINTPHQIFFHEKTKMKGMLKKKKIMFLGF